MRAEGSEDTGTALLAILISAGDRENPQNKRAGFLFEVFSAPPPPRPRQSPRGEDLIRLSLFRHTFYLVHASLLN